MPARPASCRRQAGWGRFWLRQGLAERETHQRDLLHLIHDDFLRNRFQLWVLSVLELSLSHVDGAMMVRHHHRHEIMVDIPGRSHLK